MHECPNCYAACDCDGEAVWLRIEALADACICECKRDATTKEEAMGLLDGITGKELVQFTREQWEWEDTRRIGCAEYDPETNVIKLHVYKGNSVYEVDLDRCTTSAELADWLFHLAGKRWCEGSVLTDLILCMERAIYERHHMWAEQYFRVHE